MENHLKYFVFLVISRKVVNPKYNKKIVNENVNPQSIPPTSKAMGIDKIIRIR